ncbi:putative membrane protein [Vibrio cholerae O1 str. 95412]|nr:putative membrane protein [Vibrio cholerae O1 str. 95412]KFD86478.1 putative membrane protein [Vibrio cholerae]CSA62464.1 Uncharacterised protein [Vibrio cholerae]
MATSHIGGYFFYLFFAATSMILSRSFQLNYSYISFLNSML